jgi:hypothetical protein
VFGRLIFAKNGGRFTLSRKAIDLIIKPLKKLVGQLFLTALRRLNRVKRKWVDGFITVNPFVLYVEQQGEEIVSVN